MFNVQCFRCAFDAPRVCHVRGMRPTIAKRDAGHRLRQAPRRRFHRRNRHRAIKGKCPQSQTLTLVGTSGQTMARPLGKRTGWFFADGTQCVSAARRTSWLCFHILVGAKKVRVSRQIPWFLLVFQRPLFFGTLNLSEVGAQVGSSRCFFCCCDWVFVVHGIPLRQ